MDILNELKTKKIILFGASRAGREICVLFPDSVAYFVDNNPQLWGEKVMGRAVCQPESLLREEKAQIGIIISSMYYAEIAEQLRKMGFTEGEHFFDGALFTRKTKTIDPYHISVDYPVRPEARYGYGKPVHQKLAEIIGSGKDRYRKTLESFTACFEKIQKIPHLAPHQQYLGPYWLNPWLSGLDAVSIYSFIALKQPKTYLEIGSGNSTKFARQAIDDFKLGTRVISIDPQPRQEIDRICHQSIRERLEDLQPVTILAALQSGDLIFVDNSHRVFMNSDVTVFFMDVLPYLKPGIFVGFHDIFLPWDYPPDWIDRYYSEQYLLAAYLLAEGSKVQIELPNFYISAEDDMKERLAPLWRKLGDSGLQGGVAFWIQTT